MTLATMFTKKKNVSFQTQKLGVEEKRKTILICITL